MDVSMGNRLPGIFSNVNAYVETGYLVIDVAYFCFGVFQ